MADQVRYIVQCLKEEPFNVETNIIKFDSQDQENRIQYLNDILSEIDPRQKLDIREEASDETAIRILQALVLLRYKPPQDPDALAAFKQGIVTGEKTVVYPIMEWLLRNMKELKVRAYLGRYLKKLDVPIDFMQDEEVNHLFQQYEDLLVEFKDTHQKVEQVRNSGFNTAAVRKDIQNMENEREQIIKRTERLKQKVEKYPNAQPMLDMAKNLREEKDKAQTIIDQHRDMRNALSNLDQRINRATTQLQDIRQSNIGATAQKILEKLNTDCQANGYMATQQLPKAVQSHKQIINIMQEVVSEPAFGNEELMQIRQNLRAVNEELIGIQDRRMTADNSTEKLQQFRSQAQSVSAKRDAVANKLHDIRSDYQTVEAACLEKRARAEAMGLGGDVIKAEEFQAYVNSLRGKSHEYKQKRAIINEIRVESQIVSRTVDVLQADLDKLNSQLDEHESSAGVSGFRDAQQKLEMVSSKKATVDEKKGQKLTDMSQMVKQLMNAINSKKSTIQPILKELNPLRAEVGDLSREYAEAKKQYELQQAGYEANMAKLEQEVRALRDKICAAESRYHYVVTMRERTEQEQERLTSEMKLYTSSDPNERKKSTKEFYEKKIRDAEQNSKNWKEQQKMLKENQGFNEHQVVLWNNVLRLMEAKVKYCQPHKPEDITEGAKMATQDRLVLR